MHHLLNIALPLLVLSFGLLVRGQFTEISVTNGQMFGSWGNQHMCPTGTYATGFNLKVHPYQGLGNEDTALNGILLFCTGAAYTYTVSSSIGSFGTWTTNRWCPSGKLVAFQLMVQPYQGVWKDDVAATNIRFKCSDGSMLEGDGVSVGNWGSWSSSCSVKGICGIQTKVQPYQGPLDDTALNDVKFVCCK